MASLAPHESLALHMNAYNALCAAHVVRQERASPGELTSILELSKTGGGPIWDQPAGLLGGVSLSLNAIEHERLRLVWDEPALHACIVCASTSCPDLASRAFVATDLRQQMDARCQKWLANTSKGVQLERGGGVARLTRIMLWFREDFETRGGAAQFAADFAKDDQTKAALATNPTLRFFKYDWNVNKVRG